MQLIIAGPAGCPYHAHAVTHSDHTDPCATASPRLCVGDETYSCTLTALTARVLYVRCFKMKDLCPYQKYILRCNFFFGIKSSLILPKFYILKPKFCSYFILAPSYFLHPSFLYFSLKKRSSKVLITGLEEQSAPLLLSRMKQVDGPLCSASAGTPRLHPQSFLQMHIVVSI